MHRQKTFLAGILIAAMLLTGGAFGCSGGPDGGQLTALEAVIQNIDSLSGIVTVTTEEAVTRGFSLADVKATTIVEAVGGLSIDPGDEVIVKEDEDGEVKEIVGNFSEVEGTIKELGIDSITIAMEEEEEEGEEGEEGEGEITLGITPETIIRIEDGAAMNFTDLEVGWQVEVKYDVTSLEAVEIEIDDDEEVGENGDEEGVEVEGIITAIDSGNYTVTITTEEEGDIVVQVTPDTEIEMEDESTAVFADLQLGLHVEVEYDVNTMDALKIEEEEVEIEGIMTAIDTGNYLVTITTEEEGDIVVQVTPDTEIEMEDESTGVFVHLQLGMYVEVEYYVSTMDALEIEVENGE
jgi:hypothetical protein